MTSEPMKVHGEVRYFAKIGLPNDCTLIVQLNDVTPGNALAATIATYTAAVMQSVPLPFEFSDDLSYVIEEGKSYSFSARIEQAGKAIWINTAHPISVTELHQNTFFSIRLNQV